MAFSASGHAARNALRLRVGVVHMSLQAKQATQAIFGCGGTCSASPFNCVIVPLLLPDQCLIAAVIAATDAAAATFLTPQCVRATAKGSGFNSASSKCSHLLSCSLRFLLSIITIVRDSSSPHLALPLSVKERAKTEPDNSWQSCCCCCCCCNSFSASAAAAKKGRPCNLLVLFA